MLLFIDGFDHYVTADITKKWTAVSGTSPTIAAGGRRSGSSMRGAATVVTATKTLVASASWVVGFAFSYTALPGGAVAILALLDAGTLQCDLRVNADGTLSVTRNGTALTSGTSVVSLSIAIYHYIEFKVTIADSISAGSCKVRVNGVDVITVATGQDLKSTANASANQVRLGTSGGGNTLGTWDIDDVYVCDQSGSTNNDFLGDVRIDTILPTSDGNYSQFTPSTGSSHYVLVDETAPNTTDYNDGSGVGDRDSYGMGNLSALTSQTVYGVQVNAAILKDDAGAKSAATFVRSSSTNGDGASAALGTSQAYVSQVFETDPNGSIAWTETTVNAMEAGVIVTA
jgi:hypothetical protein